MSKLKIDKQKRLFLAGSAGLTAASVAGFASANQMASPSGVGVLEKKPPRVRPGQPGWPSTDQWQSFANTLQGKLFKVPDPFADCAQGPAACDAVLKNFENPFFIQDTPGATQTSGWVDAWTSQVSQYAAEVETAEDVAKAVLFAREHNLRLVVKGGAHSYLGQSNAADSFLIWTKKLNKIEMLDKFVPQGAKDLAPIEAVSVQGGAVWIDVYDKAVVKGKRYVQGGGCTSVGVGGHLQTGGFGSFSKRFGMGASGIVEAEIVLADGRIVIANDYVNTDLFWAVRGAGAAYGIITRLVLKLHPLPKTFGFAGLSIKASSDGAYATLMEKFLRFYRDSLMNPHWGESVKFTGDNEILISLVSQNLDREQVESVWQPFVEWINEQPTQFEITSPLRIVIYPAENWWDLEYRKTNSPNSIILDDRPDGKKGAFWWSGNSGEVSLYFAGYESGWLHQRLLSDQNISTLAMTLVAATRVRAFEIHFNKGLAGAPPDVVKQTQQLPLNGVLSQAFGLLVMAGGQRNVHEGVRGHEPDKAAMRAESAKITQAMDMVRVIAPDAGGYSSEMRYDDPNWQTNAWGENYPRLLAIKKKYDPTGLFMAHHYVGSEGWVRD